MHSNFQIQSTMIWTLLIMKTRYHNLQNLIEYMYQIKKINCKIKI